MNFDRKSSGENATPLVVYREYAPQPEASKPALTFRVFVSNGQGWNSEGIVSLTQEDTIAYIGTLEELAWVIPGTSSSDLVFRITGRIRGDLPKVVKNGGILLLKTEEMSNVIPAELAKGVFPRTWQRYGREYLVSQSDATTFFTENRWEQVGTPFIPLLSSQKDIIVCFVNTSYSSDGASLVQVRELDRREFNEDFPTGVFFKRKK